MVISLCLLLVPPGQSLTISLSLPSPYPKNSPSLGAAIHSTRAGGDTGEGGFPVPCQIQVQGKAHEGDREGGRGEGAPLHSNALHPQEEKLNKTLWHSWRIWEGDIKALFPRTTMVVCLGSVPPRHYFVSRYVNCSSLEATFLKPDSVISTLLRKTIPNLILRLQRLCSRPLKIST